MKLKLKCQPNWNFTETEMSPKLKVYQNWNVTDILQILKTSSKAKSKSMRSVLYLWTQNEQNI